MNDESDRTIPATPRRRESARLAGLAPSPAPLSWAVATAIAILLLPGWARTTLPRAATLVREELSTAPAAAGGNPLDIGHWMIALVPPTAALILAAGVAGLATHVACAGVVFEPARLAARPSRLNPWPGIARIVSLRTVAAGCGRGLALATLAAAGWLASRPSGGMVARSGLDDDLAATALAAWWMLVGLATAAVAVAGIRHVLDRLRFERAIRMTPAELRDELADLQADPRIRFGGRSGRGSSGGPFRPGSAPAIESAAAGPASQARGGS